MVFKSLIVVLIAIPAIAVSYYFAFALPAHNKETLAFEKQKYFDQQQKEKEFAERELTERARRKVALTSCLAEVNTNYASRVAGNGTRDGHGGYSVPVAVANQLLHQKEDEISECHRQFGK